MSQQYPPPPPGQMPPNYGAPQPGYGVPATRTSGAAIASLICGILGCIPVITSLLAIILGFVGISATGKPGVSGRGLAIGGLILGIVGLLGWGIGGYGMYWGVGKLQQLAGDGVKQFLQPIIEGDLSKAMTETSMNQAEVAALREKIAEWGTLSNVKMSLNGMNAQNVNGQSHIVMRGTATFSKAGDKQFRVVLDDKASPGKVKVKELTFE